MMPETVIRLRRGVLGFRETRLAGAYCAVCQTGVVLDAALPSAPRSVAGRTRGAVTAFWQAWSAAPGRDGFGDPVSLAG
jgi:hypothetical protein